MPPVLIPILFGAVAGSYVFNKVDDAIIDPLTGRTPIISGKTVLIAGGVVLAALIARKQGLL